jgi:hypothetical protein
MAVMLGFTIFRRANHVMTTRRHSHVATMSRQAILHAYRHLYRQSLRAVQFSKPARYTLRDRLRLAFRKGDTTDFVPTKIENTLEFLGYATRENGLEHKIVKNLLFVWWAQDKGGRRSQKSRVPLVPWCCMCRASR